MEAFREVFKLGLGTYLKKKSDLDFDFEELGELLKTPIDSMERVVMFSIALKFFREEFSVFGVIEGGYTDGKNVFSYCVWDNHRDIWNENWVGTYEEAQDKLLEEIIKYIKSKR